MPVWEKAVIQCKLTLKIVLHCILMLGLDSLLPVWEEAVKLYIKIVLHCIIGRLLPVWEKAVKLTIIQIVLQSVIIKTALPVWEKAVYKQLTQS